MNKEFKSSIGYLIWNGLSLWLVFGFLMLLPVLAGASAYSSFTGYEAGAEYYAPALLMAAPIAAIPALLITVLVLSVTVSIGPDEVLYLHGGRIKRRFPLKGNVFSSNINSTYYYGIIKVNTTRMLSVITNGVRKELKCNSFTKETFDLMLTAVQEAALYANTPGMIRTASAMQQETGPARTFTLPREDIIRIMSFKRLKLNLYGLIFCAAGVAATFIIAVGDTDSMALAISFGFVFITMFLVSLGFFLYHLVIYTNFKKNTPSSVTVDANSIQIDGKVFERGAIDYIKATAPAYAKAENLPLRKILIASRFGNSEYWFGGDNILSRKCVVYGEYPALYREIANFLLRDGKLIVNDL